MFIKKTAFYALFFALFICLVSCSDDDNNDNPINPNTPTGEISIPTKTVSGKLMRKILSNETYDWIISDWNLGVAKLKFSYSTEYVVLEADVAADGTFSFTLPGKIKAINLFSPTLSHGINPSPSNLKGTVVPLIMTVQYKKDGLDKESFISTHIVDANDVSLVKTYFDVYCFDNDGTINGTSNNGDTYELNVSKGWNFIYWDYQIGTKQTYKATTTLPQDVIFYF